MQILSYQMHNVLSCYCRQLRQNRKGSKSAAVKRAAGVGPLRSESGGKRAATLEAISNAIYKKLTDLKSLSTAREEAVPANRQPQRKEPRAETPIQQPPQFVFNVIDRLNRKTTSQLSVEDSKRICQTTRGSVHKSAG